MIYQTITDTLYAAEQWSQQELVGKDHTDFKEIGGVILGHAYHMSDSENVPEYEYQFVPVTNDFANSDAGRVLYSMNLAEYGAKVITLFNQGWKAHGSYHVHPPSFDIAASGVDFDHLFRNYPINYVAGATCLYVLRYQKLENTARTD